MIRQSFPCNGLVICGCQSTTRDSDSRHMRYAMHNSAAVEYVPVGGQGIALDSQNPGHGVVDWVRKIET